MKRVATRLRLFETTLNRVCSLMKDLTAELRAQCLGRRALFEIKFAKYTVVTDRDEREVQELALRRLKGTRLQSRPGV